MQLSLTKCEMSVLSTHPPSTGEIFARFVLSTEEEQSPYMTNLAYCSIQKIISFIPMVL